MRVTGKDLSLKIKCLNARHNVDQGDWGFMEVQRQCTLSGGYFFLCRMHTYIGSVRITSWGIPREVIAELQSKNWRILLSRARMESANSPEHRRLAG
jgi:hypothetical protein